MTDLVYRRAVLKLSGESLAGEQDFGLDFAVLERLCDQLADVHRMGVELGLVIGGGNIVRGRSVSTKGIDRVSADYMGMLATIVNAIAIQNVLEHRGIETRVMTAIRMEQIAEPYIRRRAQRHLEKGRMVIFAGGTGNPYFSTDTAAVLRALEIEAGILMKATNVDGVYTADPRAEPDAELLRDVTFQEALVRGLGVMDANAFGLCQENRLPIAVFNIQEAGAVARVLQGERVGTMVQ